MRLFSAQVQKKDGPETDPDHPQSSDIILFRILMITVRDVRKVP